MFKKIIITGDDARKKKRLTVIQVLTKDFTSQKIRYKSLRKKSNAVSLTNNIEKSPLIHNQINLIKFVESCRYNTGR